MNRFLFALGTCCTLFASSDGTAGDQYGASARTSKSASTRASFFNLKNRQRRVHVPGLVRADASALIQQEQRMGSQETSRPRLLRLRRQRERIVRQPGRTESLQRVS